MKRYSITRFTENPIIHIGLDINIGASISGPSLIRVPDWVRDPLGRYYLYFAHHHGRHIRLAFADNVHGPWTIHSPGSLRMEQTCCQDHIASPDVHIDDQRREIIMYFHGDIPSGQYTFRTVSTDGLNFKTADDPLGPFYFRVFRHGDYWYALAKDRVSTSGAIILRSEDGISGFQPGQSLLPKARHTAVYKTKNSLFIFFSRIGDCPEQILAAHMPLAGDWRTWEPEDSHTVLAPETRYEGAFLPLSPSQAGSAFGPVRQLRDPAIFSEDDKVYLLYTGAGENCICGAELVILKAA